MKKQETHQTTSYSQMEIKESNLTSTGPVLVLELVNVRIHRIFQNHFINSEIVPVAVLKVSSVSCVSSEERRLRIHETIVHFKSFIRHRPVY